MAEYSDPEATHQTEAFKFLAPAFPPEEQAAWLARPSGVDGGTNLHEAAKYGTLQFAWPDALTAAGLSARDDEGRTPVHYAALRGDLPLLQARLTRTHLLAEDRQGKTPMRLAVETDQAGQLKGILGAGILTLPDLLAFKAYLTKQPDPQ